MRHTHVNHTPLVLLNTLWLRVLRLNSNTVKLSGTAFSSQWDPIQMFSSVWCLAESNWAIQCFHLMLILRSTKISEECSKPACFWLLFLESVNSKLYFSAIHIPKPSCNPYTLLEYKLNLVHISHKYWLSATAQTIQERPKAKKKSSMALEKPCYRVCLMQQRAAGPILSLWCSRVEGYH